MRPDHRSHAESFRDLDDATWARVHLDSLDSVAEQVAASQGPSGGKARCASSAHDEASFSDLGDALALAQEMSLAEAGGCRRESRRATDPGRRNDVSFRHLDGPLQQAMRNSLTDPVDSFRDLDDALEQAVRASLADAAAAPGTDEGATAPVGSPTDAPADVPAEAEAPEATEARGPGRAARRDPARTPLGGEDEDEDAAPVRSRSVPEVGRAARRAARRDPARTPPKEGDEDAAPVRSRRATADGRAARGAAPPRAAPPRSLAGTKESNRKTVARALEEEAEALHGGMAGLGSDVLPPPLPERRRRGIFRKGSSS